MTPDRFAALADAYGGTIARWPAAERDAARAHLAAHPEAAAALAREAGLDAILAGWTVPGPGAALAARIAATAMHGQGRRRRLMLWLSGLGTAATLAGGLATGAGIVALQAPAADQALGPLYQLSVLGAPVEPAEHPATDEGS